MFCFRRDVRSAVSGVTFLPLERTGEGLRLSRGFRPRRDLPAVGLEVGMLDGLMVAEFLGLPRTGDLTGLLSLLSRVE